jgi:cation:H+ antiporter
MSIVGVSILAGDKISRLALGWFGIPSIVILAVYLMGMWRQFRYERSHQLIAQDASQNYREIPRRIVYIRFALAAAAVIAAGIWLSFIGDEIATTTSLGSTFVGTLFLAISTSMPELVVCVAALRLDAIDMAIADVLGANMLDLANIAWVDIAYRQGPILCSVSSSHLITATVTVIMSLLVIAGLRFRQKRKTFLIISWYAVALIGLYVFAAYALFTSNAGL